MTEKTGYAVLQFVAQNNYCHMVHDYTAGHTIMEYAKENVILEKKKIFLLIRELANQMEQFYKCGEEAYGYLNPYAVVVTEDENISLMDIWADENREQLAKMQKKKVRSLFVSPEYVLSQRKRKEDDWYGFGKTVLFFVEKCCGKNVFTYKESRTMQKLYDRCLSGEKADIVKWKTIQKMMEKLLIEKNGKRIILPYIGIGAGVLVGFAGGICLGRAQVPEKEVLVVEEQENVQNKIEKREIAEAYMEIGLEFLAMEESSESGFDSLKRAAEQEGIASDYLMLYEYLGKDVLDEEEKIQLYNFLEERQSITEQYEIYCYQLPFLKAYAMIENELAWEEVISLANRMEKTEDVKRYLADAYENLGRYEAAIVEYEELKLMYWYSDDIRSVYEKLIFLYDAVDLPEKVEENYEEAIKLMPALESNEEFMKLKELYGIEKEEEIVTETTERQE